MRRSSSFVALLGATVLLLTSAVVGLAKEGAEARLDAPLSLEAEPGSTIDVGWSVVMIETTGEHPVVGSPIFVRLVPPAGGPVSEVRGTESPAGSGHYVASVIVPEGGIAVVVVGMVGQACDASGCARSDILFPLTDDPLVTGAAASTDSAATSAGPETVPLGPIVLVGVGAAVVVGLAAIVLARRRDRVERSAV